MNVKFINAKFRKSGAGMAKVLYASFKEDINKSEVIKTKNGTMLRTTTIIGLKIAHKVIAIYGDNATNNDTFYDHFH
jgi:hypothetical protein